MRVFKKIIDKYGFVLNNNNYESISKGLKKSINEFLYKKNGVILKKMLDLILKKIFL